MEVLNDGKFKMLSNYEVGELLKDVNKEMVSGNVKNQNLSTIVYEVEKFLSNTSSQNQNCEIIKEVMGELKSFKLTKAEKLQIINQRPTTEVEIALIIEESEERLTEDEVANLIAIIEKLPGPVEEEEEVEEIEE